MRPVIHLEAVVGLPIPQMPLVRVERPLTGGTVFDGGVELLPLVLGDGLIDQTYPIVGFVGDAVQLFDVVELLLDGTHPVAGFGHQVVVLVGQVAIACVGAFHDAVRERFLLTQFRFEAADHFVARPDVGTGHSRAFR